MADDQITTLRATAHPLRLRMLSLLTASAMSAAEVARELGITHANASYHLRLLLEADLVVVEGEERIRGGVAKRYRYRLDRDEPSTAVGSTPSAESSAAGEGMAAEVRAAEVRAMCSELLRRVGHRRPGLGTFTDAELWVSEETWKQVVETIAQGSRLLHEQARPPRTEGTVPVNLSVAAFRMAAVPSAGEDPS